MSQITLKPRMSEKAYALSTTDNTYVFGVPTSANKMQIAEAVEKQFSVTVLDVRTMVAKGKKARSIRLGKYRKNVMGKRADEKRAFVTIKEGQKIPVFAAIEEAEAAEAKQAEKLAKKSAKKSKKEEEA